MQVWASHLAVPPRTLESLLPQRLLHKAAGKAMAELQAVLRLSPSTVPVASSQPDLHPLRCSAHDISPLLLQPWFAHGLLLFRLPPTSRNVPALGENFSFPSLSPGDTAVVLSPSAPGLPTQLTRVSHPPVGNGVQGLRRWPERHPHHPAADARQGKGLLAGGVPRSSLSCLRCSYAWVWPAPHAASTAPGCQEQVSFC